MVTVVVKTFSQPWIKRCSFRNISVFEGNILFGRVPTCFIRFIYEVLLLGYEGYFVCVMLNLSILA